MQVFLHLVVVTPVLSSPFGQGLQIGQFQLGERLARHMGMWQASRQRLVNVFCKGPESILGFAGQVVCSQLCSCSTLALLGTCKLMGVAVFQ